MSELKKLVEQFNEEVRPFEEVKLIVQGNQQMGDDLDKDLSEAEKRKYMRLILDPEGYSQSPRWLDK